MLVPSHDAQPAVASLASVTLTLAGLAWWEVFPRRAAILVGAALGIGFLGDGFTATLPGLAAVVVTLAYPRWRRVAPRAWLLAGILALILSLVWPVSLLAVAPNEFALWFGDEWQLLAGTPQTDNRRFELLAWGLWPVLPIAVWSLWLNRHQWQSGRHMVVFAAALVALVLLFKVREPVDALPSLTGALAIIASSGVSKFRRGLANAFDWFGAITVTFFMAIIWLATIAIHTGWPARIAKNFTKPAPGFIAEFSPLAFVLALFFTLLWLYWLFRAPKSPWRGSIRWSVGVAMLWGLAVTLLMPWIDYGKTYRQPAISLRNTLFDDGPIGGCIERDKLTPAHRASLDLLAGIRTVPLRAGSTCNYRLVAAQPRSSSHLDGWELVLDVARPGERFERLRLYRRTAP